MAKGVSHVNMFMVISLMSMIKCMMPVLDSSVMLSSYLR